MDQNEFMEQMFRTIRKVNEDTGYTPRGSKYDINSSPSSIYNLTDTLVETPKSNNMSLSRPSGAGLPSSKGIAGLTSAIVGGMMADTTKQVGQSSANPGFLATLQPFYIIKRKNRYPSEDSASRKEIEGYQSSITKTLTRGMGYTVVSDIHLEIKGATQSELDKIEAMLKKGVIL